VKYERFNKDLKEYVKVNLYLRVSSERLGVRKNRGDLGFFSLAKVHIKGQGVRFLSSLELVSGSHEEVSRRPEANHPISPSQNFKSEDWKHGVTLPCRCHQAKTPVVPPRDDPIILFQGQFPRPHSLSISFFDCAD